jgi:hypothetical protein
MNEARAVALIRIGVTPRWLEAMVKREYSYEDIAFEIADQRGEYVGEDTLESLAKFWGIV